MQPFETTSSREASHAKADELSEAELDQVKGGLVIPVFQSAILISLLLPAVTG